MVGSTACVRTAARGPSSAVAAGAACCLVLSACSLPGSGPDPDDAADPLAAALSSGDARRRRLHRRRRRPAPRRRTPRSPTGVGRGQGLGRQRLDRRRRRHRPARLAAGRSGSKTWSYDTDGAAAPRARPPTATGWLVRWAPDRRGAVAEGRRAARRDHHQGRARRHPRRRRPADRHAAAGAARRARQDQAARRAGHRLRDAGSPSCVDIDAAAFVKQVNGHRARRRSCRRSSTAAATCPAGVLRRPDRHPGCPRDLRPAAARADQGLRRRDPRHASARRPPSWSRTARGGSRPGTTSASPACRRGTTSSWPAPAAPRSWPSTTRASAATLFTADAEARQAAAHDDRPRDPDAAQQVAGRRRPGQCAGRRSGPRPATSSRSRAGRARRATTPPPIGQYAPGSTFKVVSALALLRAGVTPQTRGRRARRPRWSTARASRTTTTTRPPALGAISFEDALANSCNTAFISQRDKLGPTSLAPGGGRPRPRRRPRHRLPDLLRRGRPRRAARPRRRPA